MRLVLAPKPVEGIDKKLLKSQDQKLGQKYLKNHKNKKTLQPKIGDDSTKNIATLMQIKSL
jgi:hypothetical protein